MNRETANQEEEQARPTNVLTERFSDRALVRWKRLESLTIQLDKKTLPNPEHWEAVYQTEWAVLLQPRESNFKKKN